MINISTILRYWNCNWKQDKQANRPTYIQTNIELKNLGASNLQHKCNSRLSSPILFSTNRPHIIYVTISVSMTLSVLQLESSVPLKVSTCVTLHLQNTTLQSIKPFTILTMARKATFVVTVWSEYKCRSYIAILDQSTHHSICAGGLEAPLF